MKLSTLDLIILALACWRLAFMLVREAGPLDIFARLRARSTLGGLLDCVFCTSVWTAALALALWATPLRPVVMLFAVSGLALMAASWTGVEFKS